MNNRREFLLKDLLRVTEKGVFAYLPTQTHTLSGDGQIAIKAIQCYSFGTNSGLRLSNYEELT